MDLSVSRLQLVGQERTCSTPQSVFASNLHARAALSQATLGDLAEVIGSRRLAVEKNRAIGHDTDPDHIYVIQSGMACRRQVLRNGEQQVTCLVLPGEICDPSSIFLSVGRSPLYALTDVSVAKIAMADLRRLMAKHRALEIALQWQARVAGEIQHVWIGNLGRRPALARMAHFFCEIAVRLDTVGLVRTDTFDFLLTQIDVANILGMSIIHTNRILQELKSMNVLELHGKTAFIPSFSKLQSVGMFDPDYLHVHNIDPAPC